MRCDYLIFHSQSIFSIGLIIRSLLVERNATSSLKRFVLNELRTEETKD